MTGKAAAGLDKPDISILSDEFLAEVRGMPHRNLAVDLLQKLLKGQLATRRRKNVVQARSFGQMLEQTLRRYGYPPDKEEKATWMVLDQADALSASWGA